MFRLTLLATVFFCISSIARAELWKDYALSDEVIEHTVIAVQGNYLDEYLVRLERTWVRSMDCLLYTSPSPRDQRGSRMPSSA